MSGKSEHRRPWGLIIKAGVIGLVKSLAVSALLMGLGFLLMAKSRLLGMIWIMAGSFAMMAWSYRRPWRLMVITCLLPPLASLLAWVVQLAILGGKPPAALLLGAAAIGLVVGFLRGKSHEVYEDKGAIWARRTVGYLLAWLVAYALTQLFHAAGNKQLMEVGRLGGIFTSAMLAAVSLMLLGKYRRVRRGLASPGSGVVAGLLVLLFAVAPERAVALPGAHEVVDQLIGPYEFSIQADRVETMVGSNRGGNAVRHYIFVRDVQVGTVQRTKRAAVTVEVSRYASKADCMSSGRQTYDMVSSGGRNQRNQITRRYYNDVQRLNSGDLSFGYRELIRITDSRYTASAFSGQWLIQVTVGDAPPMVGDYGKLLTKEQHQSLALRALNTAYSRLRGMGLGGEGGTAGAPWIGGSSGGRSQATIRQAAEAASVIAMILVAAGVAIGVANSIATAVADAAGRAVEEAAEEAAAEVETKDTRRSTPKKKSQRRREPRYRGKGAETSGAPRPSGVDTTPVKGVPYVYEGKALIDPSTGKPYPVSQDGLIKYGGDWIPPEEAARSMEIDRGWQAARAKGQRLVDDFKKTHEQLQAATDPETRAQLEQQLHRQAAELNSDYSAKNILKGEGRTPVGAAFDKAVHKNYEGVDRTTIDDLNAQGYRRGGRGFNGDDLMEFRNAASEGTPGMDRDWGLDEGRMRQLQDELNKAKPGSDRAHELVRQLDAERAKSKITLDPAVQRGHLNGKLNDVNAQITRIEDELTRAAAGSEEAARLQGEIDQLKSGTQAEIQQRLGDLDGMVERAEALKQARIDELNRQLQKAQPGSEKARRISEAIERVRNRTDIDISPGKWNEAAQSSYDRAHLAETGTSAEKALQAVTTGKHRESYQDLAVLKNDPAKHPFAGEWAEQTSSVSRVKQMENQELARHGHLSQGEAIQETARGYGKDMKTKVEPLLATDARVDPARLDMLRRIRETFADIGSGKIPPGEADAALRRAVPEIPDMSLDKATRIVDANFEAGMKWRTPQTGVDLDKATRIVDTNFEAGMKGRTPQTGVDLGKAFGRVSDLATLDHYYKENLARGLSEAEASVLAGVQTHAGNAAMMSGVADPRISLAGGALLPQGMSSILPDQAVENCVGTAYQAGRAGLQVARDSFSAGELDSRAFDSFVESVMERKGADPFKGYVEWSRLSSENWNRTDGGNVVSDLWNIGKTGAGSEVVLENMDSFQQGIAAGKPGSRMVALQGLDDLASVASNALVDPVHELSSLASDAMDMYEHSSFDDYWNEGVHLWNNTSEVIQDAPLVGMVTKGYNEIASGMGESGIVGFTQEMYEGAQALEGELVEGVGNAAYNAYDYIRSNF